MANQHKFMTCMRPASFGTDAERTMNSAEEFLFLEVAEIKANCLYPQIAVDDVSPNGISFTCP